MEALAVSPEGIYTYEDEDMFMSQLLANFCSVTNDLNHHASSSHIPSADFPRGHECSTATNMEGISNLYSRRVMATNCNNSEAFYPWDATTTTSNLFLSQNGQNPGMDRVLMSNGNADDFEVMSQNSKKRTCSTSVGHIQKNTRNVKSKRSDKKTVLTRISEECCSSDESMNVDSHQDLSPKGVADFNLNYKKRASRALATDSQSTYARKRREKINSRLRVLQNLVPNGTKVDISTMLEEAVEYVKFLQTQIKLLSSDDLWMYAPVINNGIGIGMDDLFNS